MSSPDSLDKHFETPQSVADTPPQYPDSAILESLGTSMRIATARAASQIANYGSREQVLALHQAIQEIRKMGQDEVSNG